MKIRPFKKTEFADWKMLSAGYNEHDPGADPRLIKANWKRIHDKKHSFNALAVYEGAQPIGFITTVAHFHASLLKPACYINDVYVVPAFRRQGIARKLFETVFRTMAKSHSRIEWKTLKANKKAQGLYNKIGKKTDWIIYERPSRAKSLAKR